MLALRVVLFGVGLRKKGILFLFLNDLEGEELVDIESDGKFSIQNAVVCNLPIIDVVAPQKIEPVDANFRFA
jgi:hypothetical protein